MKSGIPGLLVACSMMAVPIMAQTPTADSQCRTTATQATGYTPSTTSSGPDGSRMAGAAKGAAAGAVVGGVQNNQHDYAPGAVQDRHREDQAKSGAAVGMAMAGSNKRQDRRGERKSEDEKAAWQSSYDACMASSQ